MSFNRALTRSPQLFAAATKARVTPFSVLTSKPIAVGRPITTSSKLYREDSHLPASVDVGDGSHEGQWSRTDNKVSIEYPDEKDMPRSAPVQGRGSIHFKRTLASFSLEGRSGVSKL